MIVFVIVAIIFVLWALVGLWGARTYRKSLAPETKDLSDAIIAHRKALIIEDGKVKHLKWQKSHPLLGRLYAYKPTKYFRDNQFNTKRYPY